jgi:ParB-like chromosome segregation protein Spo0J
MKASIELVPVKDVDPNPFRLLGQYPYNDKKLKALQRSIKDVGLWEGIIGRRKGNRVEIAFGHHRQRAAELSGFTAIPVVIRDMTDEQMLQFMGRENLEDYNADFLVQLNSWEAGMNFPERSGKQRNAVDIATLLGWTEAHGSGSAQMNATARACKAASDLIKAGYHDRDDFKGLGVRVVLDITEKTVQRMELVERELKKAKAPATHIKDAKGKVAAGARKTMTNYRAGKVAPKDVRKDVADNSRNLLMDDKRNTPLFAAFSEEVSNMIGRMLADDAASKRLDEIVAAVEHVSLSEDKQVLKRLDYDLDALQTRAADYQLKLKADKVVTLQPIRR